MPFRIWHIITKFVAPPLFVVVSASAFLFNWPDDTGTAWVFYSLLSVLFVLCGVGAILGILMVIGRLRMRCPFCGVLGPAGGNKRDGIYMTCRQCGHIHTTGPFGMRLERTQLSEP